MDLAADVVLHAVLQVVLARVGATHLAHDVLVVLDDGGTLMMGDEGERWLWEEGTLMMGRRREMVGVEFGGRQALGMEMGGRRRLIGEERDREKDGGQWERKERWDGEDL